LVAAIIVSYRKATIIDNQNFGEFWILVATLDVACQAYGKLE